MIEKKKRRRLINLSIEGNMQVRLIMKISSIVFFCIFLTAAGFYFYSDRELGEAFWQAHLKVNNVRDMLLPAVVVIVTVVILVAFFMTLFFPLHIAGPKYRIELTMKRIAAGDLSAKLRLRRGDELQDIARELNGMAAAMNARVCELQAQSSALFSLAGELRRQVGEAGLGEEKEKKIEELLEGTHRLKEALEWFKTAKSEA